MAKKQIVIKCATCETELGPNVQRVVIRDKKYFCGDCDDIHKYRKENGI